MLLMQVVELYNMMAAGWNLAHKKTQSLPDGQMKKELEERLQLATQDIVALAQFICDNAVLVGMGLGAGDLPVMVELKTGRVAGFGLMKPQGTMPIWPATASA